MIVCTGLHQYGLLCFARHQSDASPNVERGYALSEFPSTRPSSTNHLANKPALTVVSADATSIDGDAAIRGPRRFGDEENLKPLQLANMMHKDILRDIQSARLARSRWREDLEADDLGTAELPLSAR